MTILKPEIKRRWVEALRSGEYSQGQNELRPSLDSYCCLGVLCDLYAKDKAIPWMTNKSKVFTMEGLSGHLPLAVVDWASARQLSDLPNVAVVLVDMNDGGKTFSEIADYIEEKL